jgi:hypothetical protein
VLGGGAGTFAVSPGTGLPLAPPRAADATVTPKRRTCVPRPGREVICFGVKFTYRLFSPDGDKLSQFVTAVPNWSAGDKFMTGDGRRFRILGIVAALDEDLPVNELWEVEPAE